MRSANSEPELSLHSRQFASGRPQDRAGMGDFPIRLVLRNLK
jgi:hypothetical protein